MNKKIIVVVLLAALGAGIYFLQKTAQADSNDAVLHGNVDVREVNLAFRVGGRVAEVKVDEGAPIKQGDVLARLDAEPLQNNLNIAQANVAALSAKNALLHKGFRQEDINQAKARLGAAQAALNEAERQYTRQRALLPEGAGSQRAVDAAQSLREQAQAQVQVAQQQLQLLSGGYRKEEIAESDAMLAQAKANLDAARLALQDATLTAPSDGMLLTRVIEKGAMVQAGAVAFSLSLTKPVWVRAYVAEAQLGRFPTGTRLLLHTDSRPQKPYHGVVGFVAPSAEFTPKAVETADLRTSLVYRIRVVVQDADSQLRQGMPVTLSLAQ